MHAVRYHSTGCALFHFLCQEWLHAYTLAAAASRSSLFWHRVLHYFCTTKHNHSQPQVVIIIIIIIITMAQQPYMGPGLLLPPLFEVTKLCAFVAVGDWSTGRATVSIDPDVPARAIWQAVRRLG
jgi:hypothetical protein